MTTDLKLEDVQALKKFLAEIRFDPQTSEQLIRQIYDNLISSIEKITAERDKWKRIAEGLGHGAHG